MKKNVEHYHLVTRGSMKAAHNTDERQERQSLHDEGDGPSAHVFRPPTPERKRLDNRYVESDYRCINGVIYHITKSGDQKVAKNLPEWLIMNIKNKKGL